MQVSRISTTKLNGNQVIAGLTYSNPDLVAATKLIDFGTIPSTGTNINLVASVTLPTEAYITGMYITTSGTGTIWSGTPSWLVSVTTDGTKPVTGNLVNGLASTIGSFGATQDILKSAWVNSGNAMNVAANSTVYLYTTSGFIIPTTANVYFYVEYYIIP